MAAASYTKQSFNVRIYKKILKKDEKHIFILGFSGGSAVKNLPAMQKTQET